MSLLIDDSDVSLETFIGKRIGVIGDFIADEYVYGHTDRISREAPVLIIKQENSKFFLGGGANVVNNIKALGGNPIPIGIVGKDDPGKYIVKTYEKNEIDTSYIITDSHRITSVKTRILAGGLNTTRQQVLRVDKENRTPLSEKQESLLCENLHEAVSQLDALIVSDYGDGSFGPRLIHEIQDLAHNNFFVSIDSRYQMEKFVGCTIFTPNEPEVEAVLKTELNDDHAVIQAGKDLLLKMNCLMLIITRGKKGMILFEKDQPPFIISAFGDDEIVDVTGAGDTVIASFTLALAGGLSAIISAQLANITAGLKVRKKGTATVSAHELLHTLKSI